MHKTFTKAIKQIRHPTPNIILSDQVKKDPDEIIVPMKEIREMNALGLTHFYELRFVQPTPPWWTVILLAVVAAAQICVGLLLTEVSLGFAVNAGWAMVKRFKLLDNF